MKKKEHEIVCKLCGKKKKTSQQAIYCSNVCRVQASQERKELKDKTELEMLRIENENLKLLINKQKKVKKGILNEKI